MSVQTWWCKDFREAQDLGGPRIPGDPEGPAGRPSPAPAPRRPRGSGRTSGLAATPRRATPARRPRAPLRRRGLGALRPGMGAARGRPNRSRSARPGPAPAPLGARSAPRPPPPRPPPAAPHLATGADRTQAGEEAEWLPRRRLPGSRQPDSSGRAEAACGTRRPPPPRPVPALALALRPAIPAPRGPPRPHLFGRPARATPRLARHPILPPHPPPTRASPMWLSSMCSMRSASVGKWSPQPPKRQVLEKKEAAAMPVMVLHRRAPRSRLCERRARRRREGPGRGQARGGQREPGTEERGREVERSAEPPGGSGRRRELGEGAGRTPRLGGGTRRAPAAVRPQPPRPRPHLAAPASNFTSPGLPCAVRGARRPLGASSVYVHYILNRSTSINYTWFPPRSTRGVTGPPSGTCVCTWPPV